MLALAAFTPELSRTFGHARGFAGGPERAEGAQIGVRFYANVYPDLPWRFEPALKNVRIQPGEQMNLVYTAENLGAQAISAQAAYSVSPYEVGKYVRTIQRCSGRTLQPGQKADVRWSSLLTPQSGRTPTPRTSTKSA